MNFPKFKSEPEPIVRIDSSNKPSAIIGAIIIIAAVGSATFFSNQVSKFIQKSKTESIYNLVQGQGRRHIIETKFLENWQSTESQARFRDFISELQTSMPLLMAAKIYNSEGILIWSDLSTYKNAIGTKHEPENIQIALEKGQLIKSAGPKSQKEIGSNDLLEIYTPLYLENRAVLSGIVEVYFDNTDVAIFTYIYKIYTWVITVLSILTVYFLLSVSFKKKNEQIIEQAKALLGEKSRLMASINSLEFGFIIASMDGNIVLNNNIILTILNIDKIPKNVTDLAKFFTDFDFLDSYTSCVNTQETLDIDNIKFGDKFLKIFYSPVVNGNKITDYVVIIQDMTPVKLLERTRDEFFAIASHELRTPLTAIHGNIDMILDTYKDHIKTIEVKEMLSDVDMAAIRLINIVNTFLEVSRIEQGKIILKMEEFDMEVLIKKVIRDFFEMYKKKGMTINYDESLVDLPMIFSDKSRVEQILINLVSNAVKYSERGSVTITTELKDGFVIVRVKDTGIGIDIKNQALLFKKFQQAGTDILVGDFSVGSGLGLYISKMLVNTLGGQIDLESSSSAGSVFFFTLPVKV